MLSAVIAFTAFESDRFANFAPFGAAGISAAAGTIFFSYIGLDAVSTAGDEVKDPQRTMPRAILAALLTVTVVYVVVTLAAAMGLTFLTLNLLLDIIYRMLDPRMRTDSL